MADEKISLLPAAGTLDGSEPVPVVKDGVTKQTTTQEIADLAGDSGLIETIAKAAFDTKITNSELVIGKWYLVTGAFTSTVFAADWDVLCIADSNSTVNLKAFVMNAGQVPVPCEYDPITPTVKVGSVYNIYITPTVADTWGAVNNEVLAQSVVTVSTGGSEYIELKVSADASVLILTNALNTTTGKYGTYDPATDTFYPYSNTYTPTLTPDGSVVTAVSAPSIYASHSSDGFTIDLMIQFTASVDFSAGTDGTVDYTLPFGTLATSRGVVCVKMDGATFPNNAIFGEEKNSTIRVQCNDNTFVDDIVITAFIQVKLN